MNIQQAMSWYTRRPPCYRCYNPAYKDGRNTCCIYFTASMLQHYLGRVRRASDPVPQTVIIDQSVAEIQVLKRIAQKLDTLKREKTSIIWCTNSSSGIGKSMQKV